MNIGDSLFIFLGLSLCIGVCVRWDVYSQSRLDILTNAWKGRGEYQKVVQPIRVRGGQRKMLKEKNCIKG